jgi:tetratricopeptide (TPR) repeat protein
MLKSTQAHIVISAICLTTTFAAMGQSVGPVEVAPIYASNNFSIPTTKTVPTILPAALAPKAVPKPLDKRFKNLHNGAVFQGYRRNYYSALNVFAKVRAEAPQNDTLLYNLSLVTGQTKQYEEALKLLNQTSVGKRNLHNKGVWQAQLGKLNEGIATWTNAPRTDTLLFNLALANYRLGHLDEALDWSKRVGFAKNGGFHELYANVLFRQKKYKDAERIYEKSERIDALPRLLVQRGNAHLAQHEYRQAEDLFVEYIESKHAPYRFWARLGLGHALYRQQQYNQAVPEYNAACQLNENSAEAWLGLGHAYLNVGGNRQAQKAYERTLALDTTRKDAWLGMAVVHYRLKNFSEALCCFEQAEGLLNNRNRNHADLYAIRAFCKMYTNQHKLAKSDIDSAVRLRKALLPYLAMSEYCQREGYFLTSLKWLERAMSISSDANARMLVNRGNLYLKNRLFEDALDDFTDAHHLDPTNVNACNGLAVSWLNMNEMNRAKALYDSLLRKKHSAILFNNRGIVESYMALREVQNHNPAKAQEWHEASLRDFEQGLQTDSSKTAYYVNMGNVYKNQNAETPAVEHYQKYLSKNAINNMAVLFGKGTRKEAARHYADIAVSLDTANSIYLYNRAKLFHDHFKAEYRARKDLQRAFKLAPTQDVALKYSPDGYVTIFLYDYNFETYHFPGEPMFDVHAQPIDDFAFLPSLDFVPMRGDGVLMAKTESNYLVTRKQRRYRIASIGQRGTTKCPKIKL